MQRKGRLVDHFLRDLGQLNVSQLLHQRREETLLAAGKEISFHPLGECLSAGLRGTTQDGCLDTLDFVA
jgi:hypothetical protein